MKKRIIFVDDDVMLLQGLQRMLHLYHNEWEMIFVDNGVKALEAMAQGPCDVIVADVRMPVMTGMTLLNEVMMRYPETVRIILSGHSDKEMVFKALGVTHQYLAKPCSPETLLAVIRRATASREILYNQELLSLVGRMKALPSLPVLYHEIIHKINNPEAQLEDIANIIARDIGMTAKILQLANSAFFGLPNRISDLTGAVSFLGLNVITALFISVHAFAIYDGNAITGLTLENLWEHSLETALLAQRICQYETKNNIIANEAFVAGILHDAGRLILVANLPEQYQQVIAASKKERCTVSNMEKRIFGHTHSTIGSYMLSLWGLPVPIVDAVAYHHTPGSLPQQTFNALTAVHVANSLVDSSFDIEEGIISNPLDLNYLSTMNLLDRLPAWRKLSTGQKTAPELITT